MIRLSKLTDYASVLLAAMARESKALWSAGELSESTGIPKPTCVKLLKLLVRHGVLNSTQGARGGYSLSRSAEDIPVKTIIEAIEGPMAITECGTDEALCRLTDHCTVMARWRELGDQVDSILTRTTLADLVGPHALHATKGNRIETLEVH
jgi:FeS assembly SUF system regulator, gammaproteobacterial